jgi:hypothetical protein
MRKSTLMRLAATLAAVGGAILTALVNGDIIWPP